MQGLIDVDENRVAGTQGIPAGSSLSEQLLPILRRPIPAEARRRAASHVLDWLGCAIAGARSESGRIFLADAHEHGPGPSRIVGGSRTGMQAAAFTNGAFGNVLEMDDLHKEAILHPGPVVVPAALAVAEARGTPAVELLDAVVRGYEAMIRLGRAMGPGHYRLFHPTSTCGPFGAAAAAADLLDLDDKAFVAAMGNAGTQAAGPWQCRHEPVMTKQLHTARAADAGVTAARLAAKGLTGPRFILEGRQGLFAAMAPDAQPQRVTESPAAPWLILETSLKPWPACRHVHAAIDAALLLRPKCLDKRPTSIEVHTFRDAIDFANRAQPRTPTEARFSLQHAVAVALIEGPPHLAAFAPPALDRPDIAALRSRIIVGATEPYASAYPRRFGTGLTARFADGTVVEVSVADALGDPENPLPEREIVAKAGRLMAAAGLNEPQSNSLIAATLALADQGTVTALTDRFPSFVD